MNVVQNLLKFRVRAIPGYMHREFDLKWSLIRLEWRVLAGPLS